MSGRICVSCKKRIRRHDKYILVALKTYTHRNCRIPEEYDWRYLTSTVEIPMKEWQEWLRTGLDGEACGGRP